MAQLAELVVLRNGNAPLFDKFFEIIGVYLTIILFIGGCRSVHTLFGFLGERVKGGEKFIIIFVIGE